MDDDLSRKVPEVLGALNKEAPLSPDELAFCSQACVLRYLRARSGNVAKATKLLRSTLKWRKEFNVDGVRAEEFSENIETGSMYIGGKDDVGRPVIVSRKKAEKVQPGEHQKAVRLIVFTLESCVAAMPVGVEQWVWILDMAGYSRANSPPLSVSLTILNIFADHYPERLAKVFIVDAPTVFTILWRAISPFLDKKTCQKVEFVSGKKFELQQENAGELNSSQGGKDKEIVGGTSIGFGDYASFWKEPYQKDDYVAFLKSIGRYSM